MATTDLGACEWFVWDLRRSNLIERGQLDQVVGEFLKRHPRAEPPQLAEYLVKQGIISQFQADRVLQGKTQGLVLGPYTLMDALGAGSMGTVYKAVSKSDNQEYAVKVLPRRSMWNVRLARRQVRAFTQFQHPAVVPFVDVGTAGGLHFLSWPLVQGESLDNLVQRNGPLAADVAALYMLQIAAGLNISHQNGLFHGLLKPSNIMIATDHQAKILDFGIGSLLTENEGESLVDTMSTANTLTSGLDCASPESIMDPTNRTPAGDQYSLGCVLYFCLTGHVPFPEGSAVEKMMAHQSKDPTPVKEVNASVPDALAAVVERLMQKEPAARYASAEELMEALRPLAAEPPDDTLRSSGPLNTPTRPIVDNGRTAAGGARSGAPGGTAGTRAGRDAEKKIMGLRKKDPSIPPPTLEPTPTSPQSSPDRVIPGGYEGPDSTGPAWKDKVKPIVLIVITVLLCAAAFYFAMQYFGKT